MSDEDATDIAPPVEARSAYEQPTPPAPLPPIVEAQAPVGERQEPPRRRSTIREPAPIAIEGAPPPTPTIPPPTPVIVTTASEDSGQPKRGWWGKRLLGDKS